MVETRPVPEIRRDGSEDAGGKKYCSPRFLVTEKGSRHTGHSKPGEAGALGLTAWELLEELLVVEEVEMDGVAEIAGPVGVGESVRSMVTSSL